jgi:hypothetical protein
MTARGLVVLAQEDRFRLQTDDGRSILLTLKPGTNVSMENIESLADAGETVIAEYEGRPEEGAVAPKARSVESRR